MPSFLPSARDDDNRLAGTSRLFNCYRQAAQRTTYSLKAVPGMTSITATGGVFFQAMHEYANDLYVVFDATLYRVNVGGSYSSVGSVNSGDTSISSNNDYLTIAAGGTYYAVTGNMISSPSTGAFSSVGSVAFEGQRTLITEKDGRRWSWSDVADATTFNALNFATAEGTDGSLVRVKVVNGRVVLFKTEAREVWYNTGLSGADAYKPVPGGNRQTGVKGYDLICETQDALFFIGNDNIARLTVDGAAEQKFSYPPVDTAIAAGTATECFYYENEGNKFCVVRFSDRPAWVLDLATGEWHERGEGTFGAWTARGAARLNGVWHVADNTGNIYTLTQTNADAGKALQRIAVSETFDFHDFASVDKIRIFAGTGYSDLGRDAQILLRISRNGGQTWTPEKRKPLGGLGDHGKFATWWSLGQTRMLTIEVTMSEPAEIPVFSDFLLEVS